MTDLLYEPDDIEPEDFCLHETLETDYVEYSDGNGNYEAYRVFICVDCNARFYP